jgi:hypothetical protein
MLELLGWYAWQRFGVGDREFIGANVWNEFNQEQDPRVFQAFVWRGE